MQYPCLGRADRPSLSHLDSVYLFVPLLYDFYASIRDRDRKTFSQREIDSTSGDDGDKDPSDDVFRICLYFSDFNIKDFEMNASYQSAPDVKSTSL